MPEGEKYTHGYHQVIVGWHSRRTAETCAAFLLPRLRPDAEVLDIGCGTGTITAGLARRAGRVVGLDLSADVVDAARAYADDCGLSNMLFEVGSVYELPWDDASFDVVYAHQVLQHLSDPVGALREARRVLRPGGLVAVRDSDYETMVHAPVFPAIDRWRDLYHQVATANGGEADAGRYLLSWVTGGRLRRHRGHRQHHRPYRCRGSDCLGRDVGGTGDRQRLRRPRGQQRIRHPRCHGNWWGIEEISEAFRQWSTQPDGFWAWINGEVIGVCP